MVIEAMESPHLLSALIVVPLLAMIVGWMVRSAQQAFLLGIIAATVELALSIWLLTAFHAESAEMQFAERIPFTSFLSFHVGVEK